MDIKFSFNLQRLVEHIKNNQFGIVSAFLAGKTKAENLRAHKDLKDKIRGKGYGYKELKGFWKGDSGDLEEEYSLFVPKITFLDVKNLGAEYGQEAVIYGNGDEVILFNTRENSVVKQFKNTETNAQDAWTSYSKLKNKSFRFSSVDWYLAEPHKRDTFVGALLNDAWFDLKACIDLDSEEDFRITTTKKAHLKLIQQN